MTLEQLLSALSVNRRIDFELNDYVEGGIRVYLDSTPEVALELQDFIVDRWESKFREEAFAADSDNYESGIDAAKGSIYMKKQQIFIEFRSYQRVGQHRWFRTYSKPEPISS
jgi:hypothetical protein